MTASVEGAVLSLLARPALTRSRFTEMAVGVCISSMPATSIFFRNLNGTYSRNNASSGRPVASHSADTTTEKNRQRRNLQSSSSRRWQGLDGSQTDLTHCDTAFELGDVNNTRTLVLGGEQKNILGSGIYFSSTISSQYSEATHPRAIPAAHIHRNAC